MNALSVGNQPNMSDTQAMYLYQRREVQYKSSYYEVTGNLNQNSENVKDVAKSLDTYEPGSFKAVGYETSMTVIEERAYAAIRKSVQIPDEVKNDIPELSNDYYSPENTAKRIVDFATGLYDVFKGIDENKNLSNSDALSKFEDIVRSAIDEGFKQARDILKGLSGGEINSDTNSLIDETYKKVQEKLAEYFSAKRSDINSDNDKPTEGSNNDIDNISKEE